jgi:hypothetical protein
MVEQAEEHALVRAAVADVEGRANVLLRQLEDADHRGVGKSPPFCFLPSFFFVFFSSWMESHVSEVTMELEGLRTVEDIFLNYPRVVLGRREDRLWAVRRRVTIAIESSVRHSTGVSLAMAELSVGPDLTGVEGFPTEEPLRHHKDLVARYGMAKEVVATLVPT